MSKICNKCGKENPENLTFCEACGTFLGVAVQDSTENCYVLKDDFERVFRDYLPQREKYGTTAAPIAYFIKDELKNDFINLIDDAKIPYSGYYASVGAGNLAHCPQLSLSASLGDRIGLHFLFVFKADMSGVYLSMRYSGRLDSDESLKTKRDVYQYYIRKHFPDLEFLESIDLKSDTAYSKSYVKSTIISKFYRKDNIPSDDVLINDLKDFIKCGDLLYELKPLEDEDLIKKVYRKNNGSDEEMFKICNNCGKEVKDEFDFCVYCGSELPKHYICPDCKEEYLEIDYEYCGKCGGKLIPIDQYNEIDLDSINIEPWEKTHYKFWTAFLKEAERGENDFFEFWKTQLFWPIDDFCIKDISPNNARLICRSFFNKDYVQCKLHIGDNIPLFNHLLKRKDHYERQFGSKLIWDDKKNTGYARNIIIRTNLNFNNHDNWDDIIHWFIDTMNKFCEVFRDEIIEFAGTINDNEKYQYWLKVENELSKTNLKNLHNYTIWNYKKIGFSSVDLLYGFMEFGKFERNRPMVKFIIRDWNMYEYIVNDKENIEKELGFNLNWDHNWHIFVTNNIPNKPEFEDEIIQWQIDTALKIDKVISKRIKEFLY